MNTSLLPPAQWAQNEFGFAQLGDPRRNKRLVKIGEKLAANPGGTLPQAFPEWAELKAAYRFFDLPQARFDRILAPHVERTVQSCRQPGEYLIIEDTTLLDYSKHPRTQGLGRIGDGQGRGFELHSALAMRVEAWTLEQRPEATVVGLLGQRCLVPKAAPKGETRWERLERPRKSERWTKALQQAGGPPAGCQWIYVADREADCYETIQSCREHEVDYVIRNCQDRRLAQPVGHVRAQVAKAPLLGRTAVEVRARGGQPARTAVVEIRSVRVDLDAPYRPGGRPEPLRGVWIVEVKEVSPPEGVAEPLHWVLLTSLPCVTFAQAQRVVGRYSARWWIEEYHKALKTGAGVQDSQLEQGYRLEGLIAVLAVVAVRLLSAKMLARSRPDSFEAVESFGPEILTLLEKKVGLPKGGWTNRSLIRSVAHLGGFIGRKSDGEPGWQTIWRGWQRLMWMCAGVNLMEG
jgi:hypothetical protein